MHFGMGECHIPFLGHCDLDLGFRTIASRAYLLDGLSRTMVTVTGRQGTRLTQAILYWRRFSIGD